MLRAARAIAQPGRASARGIRHGSTAPPAGRSTRQLLLDLDLLLREYMVVDQAWLHRISRAIRDLEQTRPGTVSIVGDRTAGVHRVTNAILDDPLANATPQDVTVALEARTLTASNSEATTLSFGDETETVDDELKLPAKWLHENNTTITEIVHGDVPLESSFSTLHLSDAVLVLVSSATLLSSRAAQTLLLNLHTKPNLVVCVNTADASPATSASIVETLQHQLDTLFPSTSTSTSSPTVMALSTEQAIKALTALAPSSATGEQQASFEDFQIGYLASQIPKLKEILANVLASNAGSPPTALQEQTASYVLDSALSRAAFSAATLQDTLSSARSSLLALSQQASESSQRLLASLGVDSKTGMFPLPAEELVASRQALEEVFRTRLQFYKLPFAKIDDISSELSLVVSETYLTQFEKHLLYSTGRFSSHSNELSNSLSTLLSKAPFAAPTSPSPAASSTSPSSPNAILHSSVLENALAQSLHPHPDSPTAIPSTALSTPVATRRHQLVSAPVATLHRRAQAALTASVSIAVASCGSALGLDLVGALDAAQAVGAGLLGATFAAWTFQGRWERAKAKFWRDFDRVGAGVGEDLGVVVARLVERSEWTTTYAVRAYEDKIRAHEQRVERLKAGLQAIARERESTQTRPRE
ncbi:hypothetical protein JCM11491_003436 [Sporobolomyces phaffii]